MTKPTKLLRIGEVADRVGLSRDSIYRLARQGRFPPPLELGPHSSAWREHDVQAWIDGLQPAKRGVRGGQGKARTAQPAAGEEV
jgi:prophage regulatory protein